MLWVSILIPALYFFSRSSEWCPVSVPRISGGLDREQWASTWAKQDHVALDFRIPWFRDLPSVVLDVIELLQADPVHNLDVWLSLYYTIIVILIVVIYYFVILFWISVLSIVSYPESCIWDGWLYIVNEWINKIYKQKHKQIQRI